MYLQRNLAPCQYLLIEQQTAQFMHKWEAMAKWRNLDDFPMASAEFTKLNRGI